MRAGLGVWRRSHRVLHLPVTLSTRNRMTRHIILQRHGPTPVLVIVVLSVRVRVLRLITLTSRRKVTVY
jgi:hypothetical protein